MFINFFHFSDSPDLKIKLNVLSDSDESNLHENDSFILSYQHDYKKAWYGKIDEKIFHIQSKDKNYIDLNRNKKADLIEVAVFDYIDSFKICIDINLNKLIDTQECISDFNQSGQYTYWDEEKVIALMAFFNPKEGILSFNEGESSGDSHGEGVASVIAGHNIGNKFDGIAPGAKILDFDLGEPSKTIRWGLSLYLRGIETLAKAGAEVINISYSLYFINPELQSFFSKSLSALVKKYNTVISFSAGNNGPGLFSLNRRNLYPDNVLVVGAFVSKDLDEHVHGVTGLPEEGRVIYYSSMGPGPTLGRGPLIISPLASLTHSTADRGVRAFSGTSSASPAAAGLAAVLISALKQKDIKIDAETIIHAIKLSGKTLPNTPYLSQGWGLPNIEKAVKIYQELINGKRFLYTQNTVGGIKGKDGIKAKGILIYSSEEISTQEYKITLKGVPTPLLSKEEGGEILIPTKVLYSSKWISGAQNHFVSRNNSSFFIKIDLTQINWNHYPGGEIFEEISVINSKTNEIITKVPITLIRDRVLKGKTNLTFELGSEEGKRFHFYAPIGLKGVIVRPKEIQASNSYLGLKLYNPSGVKSSSFWPNFSGEEERFFKITGPGHHQFGLFRSKGAGDNIDFPFQIIPIALETKSKVIFPKKPKIKIKNYGPTLQGKFHIYASPKIVTKKIIQFPKKDSFEMEFDFDPKFDIHELKYNLTEEYEMSYPTLNCAYQLIGTENLLISQNWGRTIEKTEEKAKDFDKVKKVKFFCKFHDIKPETSISSIPFQIKILKRKKDPIESFAVRIEKGMNKIKLPKRDYEKLKYVDLYFTALFDEGDEIRLGTFQFEKEEE